MFPSFFSFPLGECQFDVFDEPLDGNRGRARSMNFTRRRDLTLLRLPTESNGC